MAAGELHLTRLQAHLTSDYGWLADELKTREPNLGEKDVKTRVLLGFALENLAGCPRDQIADHITDGPNDRGIDAFYFDRPGLKAYILQSKYVDSPRTLPLSEADAKSLAVGITEVFKLTVFNNGNSKLQKLRDEIEEAISTPNVELYPILVSTSDAGLDDRSAQILRDSFESSMGDKDALQYFNLTRLYEIISPYGGGSGAKFSLTLNGCRMVSLPFNGYYGWVTGETLARLFVEHGVKLFAKNLRSGLGETEINDDILQTALGSPEKFWYFNNGVTFTSENVARSLRGGSSAETVDLSISNGSIVNGAQTTSTLARLLDEEAGVDALSEIKCLVRVLEIPNGHEEFASDVTRFNNSQNGIGVKDFVSLDTFQQELRRGLDRDFAVNYIIRSGEDATEGRVPSITLQEATVSLVSCGTSLDNAVRAKDKISSLWRDTEAPPYTEVFNSARVTPLALHKAVSATRHIEDFLRRKIQEAKGAEAGEKLHGERAVATHGNRLFAYYVLSGANIWREEQSLAHFQAKLSDLELNRPFNDFATKVLGQFGSSYKQPLFKNRSKCADIIASLRPVELPFS